MDKAFKEEFWKEKDGKWYYQDRAFNREKPFTTYTVSHYKMDKNAKMLEFATLMKEYYEANNTYPDISFDKWLMEEQVAINELYKDIELDEKFFNESDDEKAIDLLIEKYKFDYAAGKAPEFLPLEVSNSFEKASKGKKPELSHDFIKYIFENVKDWTKGMYGCY